MVRVIGVLLLLVLLSAALASAQEPPPLPVAPDQVPIVGGLLNDALYEAIPLLEGEADQNISVEDIQLDLALNIRNVDFSLLGIMFGGGKVEADAVTTLDGRFRAVSVERLDDALRKSTGDAEISLNGTFGVDSGRLALGAEEIRSLGGGILLEAFQAYEEAAAKSFLESMLPGILVLQADFEWSNTIPASRLRNGEQADLRDPPLLLQAKVALNFLERYSALEIVDAFDKPKGDGETAKEAQPNAKKALRRSIEENQTVPPRERNAFMYLGYAQLFHVDLPPGWDLNLTVSVPKGFTVESVSDEFVSSGDRREATYFVTGDGRSAPVETAGIVTVSNRFVVSSTLAAMALVVGLIGRTAIEIIVIGGSTTLGQWLAKRRSG